MLVATLLLFIAYVNAEDGGSHPLTRWRCSEDADRTSTTLNASKDGILGRYTAELCTPVPRDVTSWRLHFWYFNHAAVCNKSHTIGPELRPRKEHSKVMEKIELNCTHACLSVDLDLVFTGCYSLQSWFYVSSTSFPISETYHYIKNKFQISDFLNNKPRVTVTNHDDEEVVVIWYFGIPLEDFEMVLCDKDNATQAELEKTCVSAEDNCTSMGVAGTNEVKCTLRPTGGGAARCYRLSLESHAPWANGMLRHAFYTYADFCVSGVALERSGSEATAGVQRALMWAGGAALALAGAALALAACSRVRAATAHSKRVLRSWLYRTNELQVVPTDGSVVAGDGGAEAECAVDVLVLYARESAAGQRAVDQLRRLIQHVTTGTVYDIHSAAVTSLAARAPAAWVRAALQRPNMRVVLLQTPAAALYVTHAPDTDAHITLRAPALGSGAVYRSPRFGDTLLQYALTLLADTQHAPHDTLYKKYYVAQFSSLPTEVWPHLVPYRRYSLPGGARLLLRDLCAPLGPPRPPGPAQPDPDQPTESEMSALLDQFAHAAHEFVHQATANPDYLADELILL